MKRSKVPGIEVQDNKREKALADVLGLNISGNRTGYDAFDGLGNPYELKTTSKNDVGTGRDVGRAWVEKLRSQYFIAAKTDPTTLRWSSTEIIACHPDDLEEWINEKLLSRLNRDELLLSKVTSSVRAILDENELERLNYLVGRGMTYNNPKISWQYLTSHGTRLSNADPAKALEDFVSARPLPVKS